MINDDENHGSELIKMPKLKVLAVSLLLTVSYALITVAQSDSETIAIQVDGDLINFYHVDAAGNFVPIQSSSGFYIRGTGFASGDWEIARGSDIILSPDQEQFAFTAVNTVSRDTMLFVYRVGETEFQTSAIPGLGQVIWSPDGRDILLTPPDTFLGGSYPLVEDAYLYNRETSSYDVPQKLDSEIAQLTVDWKRYEKHVQPGIQSESGARGTARRQDTQPGGSRTWTAS